MKVIFFGNNWLGREAMRWLRHQDVEIAAVVVHPHDRARERAEIVELSGCAEKRIFDGARLREPEVRDSLIALQPELGLSVMFGYLIRPKLRQSFVHGVVNLHPALLPFNRGSYPNVWSIIDGTPAGVTLHYLDSGLDTGDIIAQRETPVHAWDTGETLYRRLERAALQLLEEHGPALLQGSAGRSPQDPLAGSSHRIEDVAALDRIDLDRTYSGRELIDILRARSFGDYRGAYFDAAGHRVWLKLALEPEPLEVVDEDR